MISQQTEFIYGINPVREVLHSGKRRCFEIIIAKGKEDGRVSSIRKEAGSRGVPVKQVDKSELDRMASGKRHQGVAANVAPFSFSDISEVVDKALSGGKTGFIVVLDGVTDPQNLGAIIRSAYLLGVHGLILPCDNSASITSTVVKAAAGATEYLSISQVTNIVREIEKMKERGFWITGADGSSGDSIYLHDFAKENTVLVLGSEGKGMRRLVKEKCDFLLSVPMRGLVQSYNISAAAAIIMAEIARQRG